MLSTISTSSQNLKWNRLRVTLQQKAQRSVNKHYLWIFIVNLWLMMSRWRAEQYTVAAVCRVSFHSIAILTFIIPAAAAMRFHFNPSLPVGEEGC